MPGGMWMYLLSDGENDINMTILSHLANHVLQIVISPHKMSHKLKDSILLLSALYCFFVTEWLSVYE